VVEREVCRRGVGRERHLHKRVLLGLQTRAQTSGRRRCRHKVDADEMSGVRRVSAIPTDVDDVGQIDVQFPGKRVELPEVCASGDLVDGLRKLDATWVQTSPVTLREMRAMMRPLLTRSILLLSSLFFSLKRDRR